MDCPNCKRKMRKENESYHCVRCGYMSNGSSIHTEEREETDLQKYLGTQFETINYNKNYWLTFLFGPLYLSYKGCILVGTLLVGLDILLYIGIGMWLRSLFIIWLTFTFLRIIYAICANEVYISHCKKIIKKDIEKNGKLTKKEHTSILYPILSIGIYLLIAITILILYKSYIIPHDLI